MRLIAFPTVSLSHWFQNLVINGRALARSDCRHFGLCSFHSRYFYYYQEDITLYFLSVLHVMLEFPLNHQTFGGIGKELHALTR